ncbi:MAG: IclR family transcriptional regulator [Anaerolineaceae bacterium]|nr:IclR family transcriptional regulator [Anaerolineaceae bacterium]
MSVVPVRAVERTFKVLDILRQEGGSAGISMISRKTGLPKSTIFRLLFTLSEIGVVHQDASTDTYSLGFKLIELAFSAAKDWDIINLATPYLAKLRDEQQETTALAIKIGIEYTFIAQAMCQHEYRVNPVLGERYKLHLAGTGKAILAYCPEDDVQQLMDIIPNTAATQFTIRDPIVLQNQLKQIRQKGFAFSFSERIEGGASFSAPVKDNLGFAQAAVSIIGPEVRLRKMDFLETGRAVAETAKMLEMIYLTAGIKLENSLGK